MSSVLANRILFILSLAGAAVSLYLTVYHAANIDVPCGRSRGCDDVARHCSAHGFCIPGLQAIPTAAFGLMMYVSLAALSFRRVTCGSHNLDRRAAHVQWLLALGGITASAGLTYLEAFVIRAWCKYCVASAIIILIVFIVATVDKFSSRPPSRLAPEGEIS